MRMPYRIIAGSAAFLLALFLPLGAVANPGILVIPDSHDFGEVEIGETASTQILIFNQWSGNLALYSVSLLPPDGTGFSLVNAPPSGTIIPSGGSVSLGVEFSPEAEGLDAATVEIMWANGESGISYVVLSGTGITGGGPLTIEDILAFFDAGVEAGTIKGKDCGNSGKAHLKVFKFKLLMAAFFIDKGWMKGACQLLWHAYERSDGQKGPKDWVMGEDVPELNAMILQLMSDLGCL